MAREAKEKVTDLKIDLADGCDAVLDLLGKQLDSLNCKTVVRVDIGYFYYHDGGPTQVRARHSYSTLSDEELLLVFQGIVCCLPNIRTMTIVSYFRTEAMSLPVAALEMIFRRAIRLEILFLHQIRLHGSARDFDDMAISVHSHPSLKRVNLHCCGVAQLSSANFYQDTNLDSLICPLASLPTMYYLSLDQAPITKASMEAIANSKSLKDLSLYNMPHVKSCLHILLTSLQETKEDKRTVSSSILRGLRIRSCNLSGKEAAKIATIVQHNRTLESLVFYCSAWDSYGSALSKCLANNTTLKRLEVGITDINEAVPERNMTREGDVSCNVNHQSSAKCIAEALKSNARTCLRHLCLCISNGSGDQLYSAYMPPFELMLETNYVLESFILQGNKSFSVLSPKVGFLLKLNQKSVLDRGKLFSEVQKRQNTCVEPWVDALIQHQDDLSIIYYLLSRNPALITSRSACSGMGYAYMIPV